MKVLSDLLPGESAVIDSFTDDDLTLKLVDMGCLPGETVTMGKSAPLGDPMSINVSGYCLCLRKGEASSILVQSE